MESIGYTANTYDHRNQLQDLLANTTSLQELRVGIHFTMSPSLRYVVKLLFLPAAQNLRVLDLVSCRLELPSGGGGGACFPRLSSLRLVRCSMPEIQLEALTRAAPSLAVLHIESHDCCSDWGFDTVRLLLHCPNLAALTLADLYVGSIDVYAPRLRGFSYRGIYTEFCMKPDAAELAGVSLDFHVYVIREDHPGLLWQFLGSLRGMKALKLRVLDAKDLVVDEGRRLPKLRSLERLELEAPIDPHRGEDSAAAIATVLRQCPVIRHLQLRFSETYYLPRRDKTAFRDLTADLFNNRGSKKGIAALMLGDDSSSVPGIPGLTGCWFSCLQSHLKYVKLRFELKRLNCYEVCLAKFFAENCKVLEGFQIEDGDQHFLSHINRKVERWRLNALKQSDRK